MTFMQTISQKFCLFILKSTCNNPQVQYQYYVVVFRIHSRAVSLSVFSLNLSPSLSLKPTKTRDLIN